MEQIKQTEKLVYVPTKKRGYIDQKWNSNSLVFRIVDMICGFYKDKVRIGVIRPEDIFFDREKISKFLEDLFSDYLLRVKEAGGDIRNEARRWEDCTKAVLEQVRSELRDYGDMNVNYLDELVKECSTDVRIMSVEVWGMRAAGEDKTAVDDKAAEGIESFIKPEYEAKTAEIMKVLDDCCRIECRNLKAKGMATVMLAALRSGIFDKIPPYRSIQDHFGKIAPHGIGAYSSFMPQIRDDGKWSKISEDDLERTMKRLKGVLRG